MSIIAISRGTFCDGKTLAQAVAARLSYDCVSQEMILEATAKEYGLPAQELRAEMEAQPSFWHRLAGECASHLVCVRATLYALARRGRLVFDGSPLGHLLFPGVSHVLAVRVIADTGSGKRTDAEGRGWSRFFFGVNSDRPYLCDVVLNLSRMSPDAACETVAGLAEREEFQPTTESVKALQDLAMKSQIWAVLSRDARTRGAELDFEVADGIVTVTGSARSAAAEDVVRRLIRQIDGVKWVRCRLENVDETLSLFPS